MNFVQAFISYSIFYMFYPPDYICLDSNMQNAYPCSKTTACQVGQNFKFDASKVNKK